MEHLWCWSTHNGHIIRTMALSTVLSAVSASPTSPFDFHVLLLEFKEVADVPRPTMTGMKIGEVGDIRAAVGDKCDAILARMKSQTTKHAEIMGSGAMGTIVIIMRCRSLVCIRTQPLWHRDFCDVIQDPAFQKKDWSKLVNSKMEAQKVYNRTFAERG